MDGADRPAKFDHRRFFCGDCNGIACGEGKQRITPAFIVIFVLTASMLLISTSVSSQVVIKMDVVQSLQIDDVPEFLRNNLPIAATNLCSSVLYRVGFFHPWAGFVWLASQ